MIRFYKRCFIVMGIFLLCSCASKPSAPSTPVLVSEVPKDVNADYRILSMVTSGKENLVLTRGSKFFWSAPVELVGVEDQGRAQLFQDLINENLTSKGFKIVSRLEESDYQLSAMAVVGDIPKGQSFLLNPGLLNHSGKDKGTLMIFISNPPPRQLWRGAAQIYTEEDLSQSFRIERSKKAIHGLLRDVAIKRR